MMPRLYRVTAVFPILNSEAHARGFAKWRKPSDQLVWCEVRYGETISDAHHDIEAIRASGVVLEEVTEQL